MSSPPAPRALKAAALLCLALSAGAWISSRLLGGTATVGLTRLAWTLLLAVVLLTALELVMRALRR